MKGQTCSVIWRNWSHTRQENSGIRQASVAHYCGAPSGEYRCRANKSGVASVGITTKSQRNYSDVPIMPPEALVRIDALNLCAPSSDMYINAIGYVDVYIAALVPGAAGRAAWGTAAAAAAATVLFYK